MGLVFRKGGRYGCNCRKKADYPLYSDFLTPRVI